MTRSYDTRVPASARPRGRMRFAALALALGLLVAAAPAPARADIAVEGYHGIVQEARVSLGRFADYTARWYVVKSGDTLTAIAANECGSRTRVPEIVALNPGLDPESPRVGAQILLPPRKTPRGPDADASEEGTAPLWWDFFTLTSPGSEFARLRADGELPTWRYGTRLYAVRHDQLASLLEKLTEKEYGAYAVLEELGKTRPAWLAMAPNTALAHQGSVDDADPTVRRRTEYEVVAVQDGEIQLKVLSDKAWDRYGKEVAAPSGGAAARWDLILAFLALLAAGGLAVLAIARRRPGSLAAPQA